MKNKIEAYYPRLLQLVPIYPIHTSDYSAAIQGSLSTAVTCVAVSRIQTAVLRVSQIKAFWNSYFDSHTVGGVRLKPAYGGCRV